MFKWFFLFLLTLSCCKPPSTLVKLSGVLVKPEVTTYMYGTHALENTGQLSAALKSNSINLDAYVGKQVRITGKRVEGYPLEGGPDLIEVMDIEIINL